MAKSRVPITEAEFLDAFADEWFSAIDGARVPLAGPFGDRVSWKQFIEGDFGLFARVLARIGDKRHDQWYGREIAFRFDGAYCTDADSRYPVLFAALLENELNNDPEREMQKLIFARAPLKVLLFYDWGEFEKTTESRQQWVENKLSWFASALTKANEFCPEAAAVSYVFLIGRRPTPEAVLEWDLATNSSLLPTPLKRRN
jgi:hypothetical protein